MKKRHLSSILILCVLAVCLSLASCTITNKTPDGGDRTEAGTDGAETDKNAKLATPVITISETGVATWGAVPHADKYIYKIDGGSAMATVEQSVSLLSGQSIQVRAVDTTGTYQSSDLSLSKTFTMKLPDHTDIPCGHTDRDGNGVCDTCGSQIVILLDFFAINDLHGKYEDTDKQPGVDELTTYIKQLYADPTAYEILLSSGDMWQGTVESSSNRGALMTEWMNELEFVSMTLGNHEYDWGTETIRSNLALAEFPFLAINVKHNGVAADYCQPSTVVERGGVKIGIIGAIGDCLSSISGEHTAGMSFATGDELTSLVKEEAGRLRSEGCDLIVYSIHDGYESGNSSIEDVSDSRISSYYDTVLSDGYVDLVFEGHTHQRYVLRDRYGVYHLQGGGENKALCTVSVAYNLATDVLAVSKAGHLFSSEYGKSSIPDDPSVDVIFDRYFPDSDPYTTVLGSTHTGRSSDEICEKVAELYWQTGKAYWKDYPVVLGGGYLKTRSPYQLTAGNVTYADLFSLLPFDNAIVLGSISGANLKNKFINSQNSAYHCAYDTSLTKSLDNNKTYYIVVDSYTSSYAPNGITEIDRMEGQRYARDLLGDYIASGGWGSGTVRTLLAVESNGEACAPTVMIAWIPTRRCTTV